MNYELFDEQEMLALIKQDMTNNDYSRALEKLKTILKAEQIPLEAFSLAGKLYATLEMFERAKFYFAEFVKFVPEATVEWFQLGMVEKDIGNIDGAIEIWDKLAASRSDNTEVLYYLADAYIIKLMFNEARDCLLNILENAPDDSPFISMADKLLNRIKAH